MKKIFVGVDVGQNGGIFAMREDRSVILKEAVPKKGTDIDYLEMLDIFKRISQTPRSKDEEIVVIIEDVHSLFGMSAKSNFSFGHVKGVKEAMVMALDYAYKLIPPKKWQKAVWMPEDIVEEPAGKSNRVKKDTKATSLNAAKRIFPDVDFTRSARATKPHDGIIDAALMAEYARIVDDEE